MYCCPDDVATKRLSPRVLMRHEMSRSQAIVVILRDILKVWDCFGAIYAQPGKPTRQLTTMSAGYAGSTVVPVTTESNA